MGILSKKLKCKHDFQGRDHIDLSYTLTSYLKQLTSSSSQQNNIFDNHSDEEILLDFTFLCFSLAYWRGHQKEFWIQMKQILESFEDSIDRRFCEALYCLQVCSIENQKSLYEIIQRQVQSKITSSDQLRIIPSENGSMIALILSVDKSLFVQSYLPYGVIYQGDILPLSDGTSVQYTPEMDLVSHKLHILRKNAQDFYFIQKIKKLFSVKEVSGVTFTSKGFDQVKMLEKHFQVYYCLKHLEQFFIDRSTDPYYKKLVELLETQMQSLSETETLQQLESSTKVYEKCRVIVDGIFQNDKLLLLLLRQMNERINQVKTLLGEVCEKNIKENQTQSSLSPEWGM